MSERPRPSLSLCLSRSLPALQCSFRDALHSSRDTMSGLMLTLLLLLVVVGGEGVQAYSGKVLLVSMDGFRWDYVRRVSGLKHFPVLADSGCSVDYVNNTFATVTFPCHYSIVTGLYEESHGIVANKMYDRKRKTYFSMASKESYWWEEGEPIWITMEKQRRNSTGVYFWPGSESVVQGLRPSIYLPYKKSTPFEERIKTAIGWFVTERKDFVALYFNEPDTTGHRYGPDSPEVADKVREMDGILGQILAELDDKNLTDVVNVIITSDHGMTNISMQDRMINLWDYVNHSLVETVPDAHTVTAILPREGQEAEVFRQASQIPHVTVYHKDQIPDHFHYRHNDRIMPIIIISEEGWTLSKNVTASLEWNAKGNHGYSNDLPSMKPIFFARGPDFRKGVNLPSIRSVDIYPLLCRLLHVHPAPNNGSVANTDRFVTDSTGAGCLPALQHGCPLGARPVLHLDGDLVDVVLGR
ncbi:bis(5'-adenosyl)-triphosphatase ENPP4-like isoform X2 [Babylonia areolata]|uniref:bis(5'-adenosyl)-triphosphatase ENPP4-like isoform X2 n=1 Tax=Babylonia areolata TaxID=304850 RepID=UPI003FD5B5BE